MNEADTCRRFVAPTLQVASWGGEPHSIIKLTDYTGDLDRLPMLTRIMFLKFLDDLEMQREQETKLTGKKFKPAHQKHAEAIAP